MNWAAEKRFKDRIVIVCVQAGKSRREARKIAAQALSRWKDGTPTAIGPIIKPRR